MLYVGYALFALVALALVGLAVLPIVLRLLRGRDLRRAAGRLGLEFVEDDKEALDAMAAFKLFPQVTSRSVRNVVRGRYRDVEVKAFDYQFATDCGEMWANWTQTVLLLRLPPGEGPAPEAEGPSGRRAKAGRGGPEAGPGRRSPGLDLYPDGGNDDTRLTAADEARLFHQQRHVLCTEARGGWLLVCRKLEQVEPDALGAFLDEGLRALARFRSETAGRG